MSGTSGIVQRLHRIWQQRVDLETQLKRGPKQVQQMQHNLSLASKALEEHRGTIQASKMSADRNQLQMREREAKQYDLEVKMNMVKNNREYQALKEQIAADKQANNVLADEILETLEEIDVLDTKTPDLVAAKQKAQDDVAAIEKRVADAKVGLEKDLESVVTELGEAEKNLTGDLRTFYDRLASTMREDAIAMLEDDSCAGCYTQLSPRLIDQLDMNHAIRCTSCGRLVYRQS